MVRIKKRYLVCEIESEGVLKIEKRDLQTEIKKRYMECFGELGLAKAAGNF
jgi:RNase P/RNase MRP subunit POP5